MYIGGGTAPVGPMYSGEPVLALDGEVVGGDFIVVYDEGAPSTQQFEHMEANDPRDVIARCESELAILDLHQAVFLAPSGIACVMCDGIAGTGRWPCRTVRLIGRAYRFRPGYKEEWKP